MEGYVTSGCSNHDGNQLSKVIHDWEEVLHKDKALYPLPVTLHRCILGRVERKRQIGGQAKTTADEPYMM